MVRKCHVTRIKRMQVLCAVFSFIATLRFCRDNPLNFLPIPQISPDETDERSEVARFMAHVPNIPTQADIEAALVERKKRELLETFLGD